MMLRRRRRATLRLYASAVRRGVRVPKMLTLDERFEAIIVDVHREVRADKMDPLREPDPKKPVPAEEKPGETTPDKEKSSEEK